VAEIRVEGLTKEFGSGARAVDGVSLTVPEGQIVTLLGPSGCGKTTILRCIAGLETPSAGRILIGDQVVHDGATGETVPVEKRAVGMVFQSYAIWPHLTVFDNVALALEFNQKRSDDRTDVRSRVVEVLRSVGMDGYQERYPSELSGGQQQRVVLARALVYRPRVLLLDEPLANLDARLREAMRFELRDVQQQLGLTVIYVTHDQAEAMALSDHVIVMREGQILRQGAPRAIFADPEHPFVADFLGVSNRLAGEIVAVPTAGRVEVELAGTDLSVMVKGAGAAQQQVWVAVRPSRVGLYRRALDGVSGSDALPGRIVRVTFLGEEVDCQVQVGDLMLQARDSGERDWRPGEEVEVRLAPEDLILLPHDRDE
jgi:iron(III) transport system ATP-binding protein